MEKEAHNIQQMVESLVAAYALKLVPRSGWLQSGITESRTESVASHSWGMAFLFSALESYFPESLDRLRILKMAILHDLAESQIGDLTPRDGVPLDEKHDREQQAFRELVSHYSGAEHLLELWDEFEAGISEEAQVVRQLDKLDMLIQASIYEKSEHLALNSFWENMAPLFKNSVFESIFEFLRINRQNTKGS